MCSDAFVLFDCEHRRGTTVVKKKKKRKQKHADVNHCHVTPRSRCGASHSLWLFKGDAYDRSRENKIKMLRVKAIVWNKEKWTPAQDAVLAV